MLMLLVPYFIVGILIGLLSIHMQKKTYPYNTSFPILLLVFSIGFFFWPISLIIAYKTGKLKMAKKEIRKWFS